MTAPTESTSAALRRVEAERDELDAQCDRIAMRLLDTSNALRKTQQDFAASQADLTHIEHQLRESEAERMKAERERDETAEWWRGELHLVEAELVSARTELAKLRTQAGGGTDG